jgi:hypothetical protein
MTTLVLWMGLVTCAVGLMAMCALLVATLIEVYRELFPRRIHQGQAGKTGFTIERRRK